jgi:hypothetical protein
VRLTGQRALLADGRRTQMERGVRDDPADQRLVGSEELNPMDFVERLLVSAVGLDEHDAGELVRAGVEVLEPVPPQETRHIREPVVVPRRRIPEVNVSVQNAIPGRS